jgi:hypothetical protein
MAFAPGEHGPPAFLIGVDVMKIQVPMRGAADGVASFLHTVGETTVSVCDPPISPLTLSSSPPVLSSPCMFSGPEVDRCREAPCLK